MIDSPEALTKLLQTILVSGSSGGGDVMVKMTCTAQLQSISINPRLLTPAGKELLERLICIACNDAHIKLQDVLIDKLGDISQK